LYLDEFMTRVAKDPLPPVVLFTGDAEDIKAEGLSRLKASFRKLHPDGQVRFYDGNPTEMVAALADAGTPSLFRESKMLVFLNAQKALTGEPAQALAEYLDDPVEGHHLVLLTTGGRKDSKAGAALKRAGWTIECSALAPWKAAEWVTQRAAERGLRIGRETAQELLAQTGIDVTRVRQALDILEAAVSPRKSIDSRDLASVPLPGSEPEIYELMDAVGKRNAPLALSLLGKAEGEERGAASVLYQRCRELFVVALAKARGMSQPTAAQELGLHPFRLKNLWEQASNYRPEELKGMVRELVELQAATVTGRLGKNGQTQALEAWLLKRLSKR